MRNLNSVYDRLFAHDRYRDLNLFTANGNAALPNTDGFIEMPNVGNVVTQADYDEIDRRADEFANLIMMNESKKVGICGKRN